MPIRAKFKPTPEGEFHAGIPARDLTDEDYAALDKDQRETVRGSKLYRYATQEPRRARTRPAPDEAREPERAEPDGDQPDDPVTETPEDFAAVAAEEGMST